VDLHNNIYTDSGRNPAGDSASTIMTTFESSPIPHHRIISGIHAIIGIYKLNPWKTFAKVYLPHALPQILVGLRLGLGVSWMAVVA